ncbi:MAG TPA: M23 family metallopeptidase, partial [Clostridia bacterium]|nr:M23 family metallopeptidase [Clostridia bacterium]
YIRDSIQITSGGYIKWIDFTVSYNALTAALSADIKSYESGRPHVNWIAILAYLASRYGGNFSRFKQKDIDSFISRIESRESIQDITANLKYYAYYYQAYKAILAGFVGSYLIEVSDNNPPQGKKMIVKYGLKAFSPIAKGYSFSHCRDFGNQRNFGYSRKHLGNDLMGSIGTPIVAVESGIVEELGWNRYGGWRIGIRSFDKKRYYYYAHLRKNSPYHKDMRKGRIVKAGDVIGYLGMTGYSYKENVNNINVPHLHFGLQIIFDESQKDGVNQIWIDVYNLVELLQKNKSAVTKDPVTADFNRTYDFFEPGLMYGY